MNNEKTIMRKFLMVAFVILSANAAYAQEMKDPKATEVWEPEPKIVTPGAAGNAAPPTDAVVLFDGTNLDEWASVNKADAPAEWTVSDGVVTVKKGTGNIQTKRLFTDYQLHLELDGNGNGTHAPHDAAHAEQAVRAGAAEDGYCPHCHLLIDRRVGSEWPPEPLRCPHCRLLVGAGRARPTPAAEPGARGSAAGVFAHEAKRTGEDGDVSEEEVRRRSARSPRARRAPRAAADGRLPAARLRRRSLPALSDVFAAYGSWKRARRAAAGA